MEDNKKNDLSEKLNEKKEKTNNNTENKHSEESDYQFIKEKIKDRPINKKRLIKQTVFTGSMAIIFGMIACFTFILLEPFLDKLIEKNSDVKIEQIYLPEVSEDEIDNIKVEISDAEFEDSQFEENNQLENTIFEETPLEDMNLDDQTPSENDVVQPQIVYKQDYEIGLEDYQLLYRKMHALSDAVKKSMVVITSVSEDVDILNAIYQNTNKTYGLIVKSNGYDLMIMADSKNIDATGNILITFCDDITYEGKLRGVDSQTGIGVYSVPISALEFSTKDKYKETTIGSSYSTYLLGSPVLAIGDPLATGESLCYGTVTSINSYVPFMDSRRQIITTDIYGSRNGLGFLFNVRGQVVGIITSEHHPEEMQNLVYAYGISSIRNLIEDLSNERKVVSIGLFLEEVTAEAANNQGVPEGAYINKVEPDSPAMEVGLVPGDVVTWIGETRIKKVEDYMNTLHEYSEGDTIDMKISRLSGGVYKEVSIQITSD